MKTLSSCLLALCLVCAASTSVMAQEASTQEQDLRKFSLTMSPLHLALPVLELTGEYALAPDLGVALSAGAGSVTIEYLDGSSDSLAVIEVGASGRYYALGDFEHGLQLGLEALYVDVFGDLQGGTISAQGNGLAVGPFIGYKFVASFGLTVEAQIGAQYTLIQGEVSDEQESLSDKESAFGPLLNINVGWTF